MSAAVKTCKTFIEKVFKSINENIESIAAESEKHEEALERVLREVHEFYVSLFAPRRGVFGRKGMNSNLSKPPSLQRAKASSSKDSAHSSEPWTSSGTSSGSKGMGKGKPGIARKVKVTRRQERRREASGIVSQKRPASETSRDVESPRKRATPSSSTLPPKSSGAEWTRDLFSDASSTSSNASARFEESNSAAAPAVAERAVDEPQATERRQNLRAQTRGQKQAAVTAIREAANAEKDEPPNEEELSIFWTLMDNQQRLDVEVVRGMKAFWNKLNADESSSILQRIFTLTRIPDGVSNCVKHMIGRALIDHLETLPGNERNITKFFEELEVKLCDFHYEKYVEVLKNCSCDSCSAVLKFDESYERFHESLETECAQPTEQPLFEDRPLHCATSEILVQILRSQFSGLSASSMQKMYYFANSTPPYSPPAISTAPPTCAMSTTVKYMTPFLRERRLRDPLPSSWIIPAIDVAHGQQLLGVPKTQIHIYDGDSLEIKLTPESPTELVMMKTHADTIRMRLLNSDSPETEHAIRIYKQDQNSSTMTAFLTRHVGIEALRAARELIFNAASIYIQVERDVKGNIVIETDHYKRRLVNLILEQPGGHLENLAEKLASLGYTLSFYTTGIDQSIDRAMRDAMLHCRGLFNLPEEFFTYPYRPWDLRRASRLNDERVYKEYHPILNRPDDPEAAWRENRITQSTSDDEDGVTFSEPTDSFYFRIVESKLRFESKCFNGKSTLPDAGKGLFLKPHAGIKKGDHLCLYANSPMTTKAAGSGVYTIHVSSKNLWFDAEKETANNLGRFANQPDVLEAFRQIKELSKKPNPPMSDEDWLTIEKKLDDVCNAEFAVARNQQLVLRAKVDLPSTHANTEVFVNYGGLRNYWIPLLMQQGKNYVATTNCSSRTMREMRDIVLWLSESELCNWPADKRANWLTG